MSALVSVVIPIYNSEKFLRSCLDTLIIQTYENWETILVDDGSTDLSGKICDEYVRRDQRFTVIHKENGGVSSARNCGIKISKGKYITFVDSDDYLAPNFIQQLVFGFDGQNIVMSGCKLYALEGNEEKNRILSYKKSFFEFFGDKSVSGFSGGKMFLNDVLQEHSLLFDEEQKYAEDLLFICSYLMCCSNKSKVCFFEQGLYHYTVNNEGALNSRKYAEKFDNKWFNIMRAYDSIISNAHSMTDKKLARKICKSAQMGKVKQTVTLLRIMYRLGETNRAEYKEYRSFLKKNILKFVFCRDYYLKKRIGAMALIFFPNI